MIQIPVPPDVLASALQAVRDNRRFWPDEATFQLAHQITPVPAVEVAVTFAGNILMQYRTFKEWKYPYNRPGWYIPGGYIGWPDSLANSCLKHLLKDLRGEYSRVGKDEGEITEMLSGISINDPIVIGVKKWMPGEHPFGAPISLIAVCELKSGMFKETEWLKWAWQVMPTDVPHHQRFQEVVHRYIKASPEERRLMVEIANMLR